MSNFKSGSGNLDFGGSDGESDGERPDATAAGEDATTTDATDTPSTADSGRDDAEVEASTGTTEYPYFVRRRNVGDERDTRLEIHVRDAVAEQEAAFRNALAEHLGTNDVAKTDAREFALLAAYERPERVAELMREEGFGALD
jgi:hypothetical protein